jgi:uncharacterized protein YecT (DUF1311 family)
MTKIFITIALSLFATFTHAASFDCAKASTFIEKAICSDTQLSELDDSLLQSYKKAMANTFDAESLKAQQKAWLMNVRNKCQDSTCLIHTYNERLAALNHTPVSTNDTNSSNIVMGRCHMNGCWWWKVEKTETIKTEKQNKLIKVYTRSTSAEYSDAYVDKHGYPAVPAKKAKWDDIVESYIFCSSKLPTYIDYSKEKKKYTAVVPFSQDGETYGVSEGIGNLYAYICHNGQKPKVEISADMELSEILLDKPTDIFNHKK